VLWGAYVPSQALTGLEGEVGRQFDIFQQYNDFSTNNYNGEIPNPDNLALVQGGRTLLTTWQPRVYSAGTNYSWTQIASGSLDTSIIIPQAQRIKAISPTKIFLAFDSEMDDTTSHPASTYGTPADYVAAYIHIYNVFKSQGVTNVVWVWTPTGYSGYYGTLSQYYPGDAYVDWLGYDPYNFYQCSAGQTTWKSPLTTFSPYYDWVQSGGLGAGAESKPMILDEYGSHNDSADPITGDSDWYSQLPQALQALPKIKALSEFDAGGICSTQIATAEDIAGFKSAGLSSVVLGTSATPTPVPTSTPAPTTKPTPTPTQTPPPTPSPNPVTSKSPSPTSSSTGAPSVPTNLHAIFIDSTQIAFSWNASTGPAPVTGYTIFRNSVRMTTVPALSYTDSSVTPSQTYSYTVEATDSAGHTSAESIALKVTSQSSTSTAPGTGPVEITPPDATSPISIPLSSDPIVDGTVSLSTGNSGPSQIAVDGTVVSKNGILNTTYLTNGSHVVTVTQNGKTSKRTIVVANKLSPLETVRNTLLAGFHGNVASMQATVIVLIALLALMIIYIAYRTMPVWWNSKLRKLLRVKNK
jgi:hypothetical protein